MVVYALLAVVLWPVPAAQARAGVDMVAAQPLGRLAARLVWLVLWLGLGVLCLLPANRRPQAAHDVFAAMALGQPSWLTSLDHGLARAVAGRGDEVAIVLALVFAVIGIGVLLPVSLRRAALRPCRRRRCGHLGCGRGVRRRVLRAGHRPEQRPGARAPRRRLSPSRAVRPAQLPAGGRSQDGRA